jgi:SMI1-KNR4 cell-wall
MNVDMRSIGEPLTEKQVEEAEKKLSVKLPSDYKEYLFKYNGAELGRNIIQVLDITTSISEFFGITNSKNNDIFQVADTFFRRIPNSVIAIARAGGGNLICLQTETGAIYFWDHDLEATDDEEPSYENMSLLAPTFNSFLSIIQPYTQEQAKKDTSSMKVLSVELKAGFAEKFKDYLKK